MKLLLYRQILFTIATIALAFPQYDEDLLILKDVMRNVSSSAPNDSFIVNVDIADTLMIGNPSVTLHLLSPDGTYWIDTSLTHLGTLGYENTFGAFLGNGSSSLEWYLTGEIDSEPIFGTDWGRMLFTQMPKVENDVVPLDDMYYQRLAYTPENDDFDYIDLDIVGIEGSYSDSLMYYKLTMQGGGFNLGETYGPWPAYVIGFINPDDGEAAFGFAYANWGGGQILSPGVWKIFFDDETNNVSDFERAEYSDGTPVNYELNIENGDKTLEVAFDYASLIDDPDFGNWPNDSNSIIVIAYTFICTFCPDLETCDENGDGELVPEEMFLIENFEELRSTIMLDSYQQDVNTVATLSNPAYDEETGNITVDYQDNENNLPIMRLLEICPVDGAVDECNEFTMYPSTHSYYEGTTFFTNISNSVFSPGMKNVSFSFTDDLDSISNTQFVIEIPEIPGCTNPESCTYDSSANLDDGSCEFFDCFGNCGGSAEIDECFVCGGSGPEQNYDCDGNCIVEADCNGVCGGSSQIDACGNCGGQVDDITNCTGYGCMDTVACNYNPDATIDSGQCTYPEDNYDCGGNCISVIDCAGTCGGTMDNDDCGVCNGDNSTCTGCMDNANLGEESPYEYAACNYEEIFTIHNPNSCLYPHDIHGGNPGDYDCFGNFLSNPDEFNPLSFNVSNPYPNPFNPTVSVDISVDSPSEIYASVFDARGKLVHVFDQIMYSPGLHTLSWTPIGVLSGIYFLRLSTESDITTHKLVLLK